MQLCIAMFQLFQLTASEKRTDTACYGGGSVSGYTFEFVGSYFRFYLFEFLLGKIYLLLFVSLGFLDALQFGFLFLYDEIVPFQMLLTSDSFCLPTFHQQNIGSKGLHGCHILIIELSALSSFVVHPVEDDMSMIVRLEPSASYLEALCVFRFRLPVQPMPFVFMQEKERERKGKNGKIIKVAGCSPIREGVLLIRPDTTLADVRKFGEECQRRWGITPLQIFLHKDEGHWLNGQPEAEDKESFQVGNRWFKPNYHAHVVFDWMNHETGKSRKLNDEDMATMQTLASDILLMERGQAKAVTGKEHLERNDFIIEKQKAELQRIEETKRHKEQQVSLAEQELKQVKAEIRTDKLKKTATNAATAIASGVGSLFGSGKLKELEHHIEQLHQEITKRDKATDELKIQIQQIQEQHSRQIRNLQRIHNQELEAKDKEISRLSTLLEKAHKWFPMFKEMLRMEKLCAVIGFTKDMIENLLTKKESIQCSGKIYSEEHRWKFDIKNDIFRVEKHPMDSGKLMLTINRQPIVQWFKEQWEKLQQNLRNSVQREQKSRGFRI